VGGRANDGGLRIGEMERDGVLAHGMSYFLNESFLVRGDEFYIAVCNKTGAIAIYNESKNLFLSPYADGPIQFVNNPDGTQNIKNLSKFGRSFSILRVPYSLKLLMQELLVMNVQMRIITDDNVDQLLSMSYSDNINKLLQVGNKELKDVVKEYSQNINAIIYKENNININKRNEQKEIPSIPEPVILESEKVIETESPQYDSPPYAPNSPQYDSPSYAPNSPQYDSPPYAPNSPNIDEFKKIPIENISDSNSEPMPTLEKSSLPTQESIVEVPNLEMKPNILEVETPKEVEEVEVKDQTENKSETKKVSISEENVESNSEDSRKITF
jgi:hypothetical protein